ncbi:MULTISPECIES: 1,2-phenylacetyl-CoA epoxidase subunit PaaC [Micrococcaceae]|uniref:Phenylacetate-CoA oxygenase, PaaI subunit n=1 Tax=Paenarthrobacter aurescens (strain TC1) TaxID=290340 RepID=A1R9K9_PAEAT|nr:MULTISPECIES: 1,2-phenylacetyl-CoA epoxidase subunit PaaC [Micrococcaceae]ABM09126.1 phenylacetate-CoA oxygenase, PaaI subunit [Paenarthrobacter aurescens TC1]AFR30243.1 ring 1,2-phenylacetyl-CoA epoxidase component [Arthrobacter sp. Rue61a]MBP2264658.1 ring-1,2-phenylacetyl-CoA epoxidase subunit PaaC [Pseudarthrobacter sp. PvP004]
MSTKDTDFAIEGHGDISVGVQGAGASGDGSASATRITPGNALRPEDIALEISRGQVKPSEDVAEFALRIGDDGLILAQRLGHWISRAPELEEDIALGNIALDQLGHARSFLTYAGAAWGKSEDDLAYFRREHEFRSAHLFEQPNGDFAVTIARQFIVSFYQFELYTKLMESTDATLAAISAKAVKEVDYHRDHSAQWVLRLAGGTDESRARIIQGFKLVWPYVDELFEDDELTTRLAEAGVAVQPSSLRAEFDRLTGEIMAEAELEIPGVPQSLGGGRKGKHSEFLGYILAEMQVLAREHPGASW